MLQYLVKISFTPCCLRTLDCLCSPAAHEGIESDINKLESWRVGDGKNSEIAPAVASNVWSDLFPTVSIRANRH